MARSQPFVMSKCVFYLLLVFTLESDANKWTHDKQTISWSGYTWRIKDRFWGPGPNQFTADSVSVIDDKILSLTSKPLSGGKWSSAEVYTVLSLGHGTYRWIIESEIANLPPQVALGFFTWDDIAPKEFYREIDIQIAKFGQSSWSTNSQFTVLPSRDHSKITRFAVEPSSGRTQAEFTWSPCGVTFRLTKEGDKRQYFNHTDASLHLTAGNENVHINLWLFDGLPPTPREPVTINISSFTWLSLQQTNPIHVVTCAKPHVEIESTNIYFHPNSSYNITCFSVSSPRANLYWTFYRCKPFECYNFLRNKSRDYLVDHYDDKLNGESSKIVVKQTSVKSTLKIDKATTSGVYRCNSKNRFGSKHVDTYFIVTSAFNGFNLKVSPQSEFIVHDNIELTCEASKFKYNKLDWYFKTREELLNVKRLENSTKMTIIDSTDELELTLKSTLLITDIVYKLSGIYYCNATINHLQEVDNCSESSISPEYSTKQIKITAQSSVKPSIIDTNMKGQVINVLPNAIHEFYCAAQGKPRPKVEWFKNGTLLRPTRRFVFHSTNNKQRLIINGLIENDLGEYKCIASVRGDNVSAVAYLSFSKESNKSLISLLIITSLIFALALCVTACIVVKYCKAKHLQYLTSNLLSPITSMNSFNPDLPLDEQVDLLSYDSAWEFPPDRLKIIQTLGEGAFGRVVLAQAIGLGQTDSTQLVAVKMLKPNADFLQIKALISELKILIHMGHHLNIVNCLGAVTKNRTHDQLMVIVEYCKFGNLRNFLRERRKIFIDQIDLYDQNDESSNDENFSKPNKHDSYVEPHGNGNSCSSINNDSGNCSNSNDERRTSIKESKLDLDSNDNEQLATRNLIAIAFQVARGMEYLQQKKLIHRDLAARNVLVADKGVVKICDFGLAKDIQKDYNYIKKVDTPLPIKWMAIESIGDRLYTTQSDVWSFGVLLWEIFTLGRSPYPGLPADQHFYLKLVKGYRMERPDKCPQIIYKIMTDCWLSIPIERPNFKQLVNRLGELIDESIRDYYIELDTTYKNNEALKLGKDNTHEHSYLTMGSSSNLKLKNEYEYNSYMTMGESSGNKKTVDVKSSPDNPFPHYDAIKIRKENINPMEVVSMIHFDN